MDKETAKTFTLPTRPARKIRGQRQNTTSALYIRKHRAGLYWRVVRMLASPEYNLRDICNESGLALNTVRAIHHAEPTAIADARKLLTEKINLTLRRLVDRVEQKADTMRPRDAIFGVSVFFDKLNLLTGSPTSHAYNVNINASVDLVAEMNKLHDTIRARNQSRLKDKTSDPPSTVSDAPRTNLRPLSELAEPSDPITSDNTSKIKSTPFVSASESSKTVELE
jgi:hypothetical protein